MSDTPAAKPARFARVVPLVPIYTDANKPWLIPEAQLPPREESIEDEVVHTTGLRFDRSVSLLGISQSNELLERGMVDSTDSIYPSIQLARVYLQAPMLNRVVAVELGSRADTIAVPASGYAEHRLNLLGQVVVTFWQPGDREENILTRLSPVIDLAVSGLINLETGHCEMRFREPRMVRTVMNPPWKTTGGAFELKTLLTGLTLLGYDLTAWRVNHNCR